MTALRVLGDVARNRALRRVELAFACFNSAEWAVWIAMLVYAYGRGGATTAGFVALAQLVPAGIFAPFGAVLADRQGAGRVLALGYAAQACAMAAVAVALLAGGPPLLAYALAALAATAVTITRPAQAAVVPALARTPEELTATNVVSGWIESAGMLAAPAATGVLLEFSGPGTVFAAMAGLGALAALLVARLEGPPAGAHAESAAREIAAGARLLARSPEARVVAGLLGAQYVVIGALDVLFVVLAIGVLDLGGSGAGYLNAAFGAGGVLGIVATTMLVGRPRLAAPLVLAIGAWAIAFGAIAVHPETVAAFLLLACAGGARSLFDVAGRTLLQRSAPPEVLGRVFGVLEGMSMAGLAIGALLAPALVGLGGARAAFAGVAVVLPLLAFVTARPLLRVDRSATVPVVEISLLRALPLFAALGAPELEALARRLVPVSVGAGEDVVRQGEPGDRFYAVAAGELDVVEYGRGLTRGDAFGEIALLLDVPRTATVRARTKVTLLALEKHAFLEVVARDPRVAREAERLVHERLAAARMPA